MLTLTKNENGWLFYRLTDDPAKSQADGLKAWRAMLEDIDEARTPDESAEPGRECDNYWHLHDNIDLLLRYLHDLRDYAEGADARFIADVFTAFREWVEESGSEFDFAEVLELFAAAP